jgi:hypothetical protein
MADNNEKEKKPRKKNNQPKNNSVPDPITDPMIMKVIRDALMIHLNNPENHIRQRSVDDIQAMLSTCQEFLKSFIIIGYNFEGQPVQPIVFAHNQQEADALGSYLSKFIQSTIKETKPDEE